MTLEACAALVQRGDPDRFLATMSVPPAARAVLFPLYAFNVEVARAPWVTEEPMIAEMRLQWWRDAVEELGQGRPPRAHEVVAPLAEAMARDPETIAALLDGAIAARRWDIYRDPFEDEAAFDRYLNTTSGHLTWAAAIAFGAPDTLEASVRDAAWAGGLANWLLAIPELERKGRKPMVDGRAEAVAALAREGLMRLGRARQASFGPCTPVLRCFWQAGPILRQAARDPGRVAAGALGTSEFRRRSRLMIKALTAGW